MKTKPQNAKKIKLNKSKTQLVPDQTQNSSSESERQKNSKIQIYDNHTSVKCKQVSLSTSFKKLKKGVHPFQKSNKLSKKPVKLSSSIKVKKIGKNIKLTGKQRNLRNLNNISSNMGYPIKNLNGKSKENKKKQIYLEKLEKQESLNQTKSETLEIKTQVIKGTDFQQKMAIDFDDNAQIHNFYITKEQIVIKRQSLLLRNIQDWTQLGKIKIKSRELRNLNI